MKLVPNIWSPQSPDMPSVDIFLWFLKGPVYDTPVSSPKGLVGRIFEAAECV